MRYITAGESHGRVLTAIVSGVPAGVLIDTGVIDADLARRQGGYGRGGRQTIESDKVLITAGVRFGRTIGSPVGLSVANRDWDNWLDSMAVSGEKPVEARVTAPRPGHADLSGTQKTGSDDVRDVLERASARETAARVAAGGIAKAVLRDLGVDVRSFVTAIGTASMEPLECPWLVDAEAIEASDVRCPDPGASARMRSEIDAARSEGDSLGGTFVVIAEGLVPGVGGYAEAASRLDARLAGAVISIPAIKGVEFGGGFLLATRRGSQVHDEIVYAPPRGIGRATNRAGGIEGGMTNGEPLVLAAAMKPIPTLAKPLASIDLDTLQPIEACRERADVCAVPAAAVVAEAEVAMVLADAYLDKFGSDSIADIVGALEAYKARIAR
jgi:chorismate synthase